MKDIIQKELSAIIDNDYIFLDLPYYTNIGDTLIWKGTEEFLKTLPYKCLYKTAIETYVKPRIKNDIIILLQGGGNFGDIWRRHTEFVLHILRDFPENKIIILPQTVFYKDRATMIQDAQQMAHHKNLTICARDTVTQALLKKYFSAHTILLLPDMAFCISDKFLDRYIIPERNKQLFFKRKDAEYSNYNYESYIKHRSVEVHEWPSMEKNSLQTKLLYLLKRIHYLAKTKGCCPRLTGKLVDLFAIKIYMPGLLRIGIRFISQYNYVYTTRLHGAILSLLLKKPIVFFDNSYGKNSSFYNTWLRDNNQVVFIHKTT